ncbi:MAG: helix-hairpin-helix domain-containing protein [Candidatus Neomarinimicrobiota bacterium]
MAEKVAAAAENTRARHLKVDRMDTGVETGEKINLNNAPKYQLMLLPGVGPALAERILIFREDHGDFESIEELARVKGIGEKTVQGLREWVTVEGQNQKDFEEE